MADELSNGKSRLDRVEELIEVLVNEHIAFAQEHKQLLTAQIVLTDRMDRLTERMDRLTVDVTELTEAQKHTDNRLNALISIVDDLIRKRPPQ